MDFSTSSCCMHCPSSISQAMVMVAIAAGLLGVAKISWNHDSIFVRVLGWGIGIVALIWGAAIVGSFLKFGVTGVEECGVPSMFLTASYILAVLVFYVAVIFRAGKQLGA